MNELSMKDLYSSFRICVILRNFPIQKTCEYVTALRAGGIRMVEVASNSEDSGKQIQMIRDKFDDMYVGAGTVINLECCKRAEDAGAQFFFTPSTNSEVIEYSLKNQIPILPGVLTPTDVNMCINYGIHTMKLFPADCMPMNYIKRLKGPFDNTDYVAVGGVKQENMLAFLKQGYLGVGIGSNLVPASYIIDNQWDKVSERSKEYLDMLKTIV